MKRFVLACSVVGLLTACGGSSGGGDGHSVTLPDVTAEELLAITPVCPERFECNTLTVPKSYANDNGDTIDIYYAVHKATDAENRIGTLFFNYGGPGGSAVHGTAAMVEELLPEVIINAFDIVAMDPRGTGYSAYASEFLRCGKLANCADELEQISGYLGSNSIVQDYDLLREHLGEESISFVGYSYGTRLGSLYANEFPDRVRALVLDSPMAPDLVNYSMIQIESLKGYQTIAEYRLNNNEAHLDKLASVVNRFNAPDNRYWLDRELVDGTSLTFDDLAFVLNILAGHSYRYDWSTINSGLIHFLENNISSTLRKQIATVDQPEQTDARIIMNYIYKAVVCTDESTPLSEGEIDLLRSSYDAASSIFSLTNYMYNSLMCADWTGQRDPVADINSILLEQQVLLIKGQYDPATPNIWGERMASAFADSASVITVNNLVDHGFSYNYKHNIACVDEKTTQYLLDPSIEIADLECDGSTVSSRKKLDKNIIHPAKSINQIPRF